MNDKLKLKVLVSAYACEPHKGSEPGVGWNWAKQIARFHEVWVITRANNREVIESELKRKPEPNLHFVYYDVPKWLSFWKRKTRGLYLYYLLWQIGAYRLAKKLNKKERFDLVHHLTFGNVWLPTFMPFLNIPFIWGPIGGGERVPKQFRIDYQFKAKFEEFVRDIILFFLRINPLFLSLSNKANFIIVRTEETMKQIPNRYNDKTVKLIETGVSQIDFESKWQGQKENNNFQIVSVGRLIHLKGFDLAIRAFASAFKNNGNTKLIIIGDGPDKKRLKKFCMKEKVNEQVIFLGQLSHKDTVRHMSESSVFLFPSLKEGGAWVLFEAMMLGLPIICLDIAGPREIVSEGCGFKIKPINPEQTINDLAGALLKLANDPELRNKMGEAGRRRVMEHYTWEKKGEFIKEIYGEVIGNR